ncbi:MAG: 7-cyano-7-deazaguanine synthase QueC [bacterium]|nr:7-cyano-7-deazaguanine synthase QueC [bacterium]
MERAVVLVSGGMDSCVTLAEALASGREPWLMHVQYGQRTQRRERQAFEALAEFYHIPDRRRLVVDISHLAAMGGSSLTDPDEAVSDGRLDAPGVPRTYVPFRNGNLLAIAGSWAEVIAATTIWLGVVEEDGSGYPDCRLDFIRAMESTLRLGTAGAGGIRIETPLIKLDKAGIVRRGMALEAPFHLTWSCYRAQEEACGTCDSCLLRLRGFRLAGRPDPIPYAAP